MTEIAPAPNAPAPQGFAAPARFLGRALGFGVLMFLVCEAVFRTVVPARESPYPRQEPTLLILNYQPADLAEGVFTNGRFATVRVPYHINSQGWNAGEPYLPAASRGKPVVAVLGDSQIEGFYVTWGENITQRLAARGLGRFDGYAYGGSGFKMAQFLAIVRYLAREKIEPAVVVMATIQGDLSGSLENLGARRGTQYTVRYDAATGKFEDIAPKPYETTPLRRFMRESALMRYLVFNARMDLLGGQGGPEPGLVGGVVTAEADPANAELFDRYVEHAIAEVAAQLPGSKLVFLMDANRMALYRGDDPVRVVALSAILQRACARHPETVLCVDLAEPFAQDWKATGERLQIEQNLHWNAKGHDLAAATLYDALGARGWLPGGR